MNITTVGIDLAKEIITVYAQDATGHCVLSRNFKFKELSAWLVQLPTACVVGMEACSTAHHWGRRMQAMGLQPRLMAAEFVQAFRKSKSAKNDHNDAEAITIAVRQPTMRFVAIKHEAQQSRLSWHGTGYAKAGKKSAPPSSIDAVVCCWSSAIRLPVVLRHSSEA
jgi:transposase